MFDDAAPHHSSGSFCNLWRHRFVLQLQALIQILKEKKKKAVIFLEVALSGSVTLFIYQLQSNNVL